MKQILFITKIASTKKEGFESRISCIAQEFVKKGYETKVITSDSNHLASYDLFETPVSKYDYRGVSFNIVRTLRYKSTISIKRVLSWIDFEIKLFSYRKKLIESEPDVIIVSSLSLLTVINGLVLKRKFKKTKFIFEVRDIWPLTLMEEGGYSKYHPAVLALGIIEKLGYKYFDAVVGTMPNLQEHVEGILRKKVENVFCVPFGIYPEDYTLSNNERPHEDLEMFKQHINKGFTIGYAGSIGLSNGLETLVQVIKETKDQENLNFIFLGEGGYKEKFEKELEDHKNVLFTGRVKRNHVKYYLNSCDVLFIGTLPSKVWKYGWSLNKMGDYMMSGKPIIAEYSGFKSMINEAECGYFIESRDLNKLKELIIELSNKESEDLRKLGKRGVDWITKNRSWEQIAANYLDIINNKI